MNLLKLTPLWIKTRRPQGATRAHGRSRCTTRAQGKDYVPWMVSRENPLVAEVQARVSGSRPHLHRLVVHLTDHCNLNCKGCTHFSNIAKPAFADPEQFEREFAQLETIFSGITEIYLLGGEPLLHPHVTEFMESARKHFPAPVSTSCPTACSCPRMDEDVLARDGRERHLARVRPLPDRPEGRRDRASRGPARSEPGVDRPAR